MKVSDSETLFIAEQPVLSSDDIASAQLAYNEYNAPVARLVLTDAGFERFPSFTAQHVGERLVFLSGNRVLMAPLIRSPVHEEKIVDVESALSIDEVRDLVAQLSGR